MKRLINRRSNERSEIIAIHMYIRCEAGGGEGGYIAENMRGWRTILAAIAGHRDHYYTITTIIIIVIAIILLL